MNVRIVPSRGKGGVVTREGHGSGGGRGGNFWKTGDVLFS